MQSDKKRVLVVDDSVFARKIVCDILESSPQLEVVGAAVNGLDALAKIEELKPDVVTMDLEMPKLNGIEALKRIMAGRPTPVIMVSSFTQAGARESIMALKLGAVDVVGKPGGGQGIGLNAQRDELIRKVTAAANTATAHLRPLSGTVPRRTMPTVSPMSSSFPVVIIASSTGGPRALRMVIPALNLASGAAYVIVQHLPTGFSATMAHDLDGLSDLRVREAQDGDVPRPGEVLLARAGHHLVVNKNRSLSLTLLPPLWGVRPAADVTMVSAAPVFGSRLIGAVLTGMGNDGAAGLRAIKEAGGTTIAEHESSCVVYGMPKVAIESGVVDKVEPIERIPEAINTAVRATTQRLAK